MAAGNSIFFFFVFLLTGGFFAGIIYFARHQKRISNAGPLVGQAKPDFNHGSPKQFSSINIYDFVKQKAAPNLPDEWPEEVEHMTIGWGEPEDNCVVELYLNFSPDERVVIDRRGLNEEVLEEELLFDDETIERIENAQAKELRKAKDDRERKALEAVHQTQLNQARRETWGKTIEYYIACPYTKSFPTPYQATLYRKKLETQILPRFRKLLKDHME